MCARILVNKYKKYTNIRRIRILKWYPRQVGEEALKRIPLKIWKYSRKSSIGGWERDEEGRRGA